MLALIPEGASDEPRAPASLREVRAPGEGEREAHGQGRGRGEGRGEGRTARAGGRREPRVPVNRAKGGEPARILSFQMIYPTRLVFQGMTGA